MTSDRGISGGAELDLNKPLCSGSYHGGRYYPTSCHGNTARLESNRDAPFIDYFDYVNPSDVEEEQDVDRTERQHGADIKTSSTERLAGSEIEGKKHTNPSGTINGKCKTLTLDTVKSDSHKCSTTADCGKIAEKEHAERTDIKPHEKSAVKKLKHLRSSTKRKESKENGTESKKSESSDFAITDNSDVTSSLSAENKDHDSSSINEKSKHDVGHADCMSTDDENGNKPHCSSLNNTEFVKKNSENKQANRRTSKEQQEHLNRITGTCLQDSKKEILSNSVVYHDKHSKDSSSNSNNSGKLLHQREEKARKSQNIADDTDTDDDTVNCKTADTLPGANKHVTQSKTSEVGCEDAEKRELKKNGEISVEKRGDADSSNTEEKIVGYRDKILDGNRLSIHGLGRLEYGTALQVDTSYNTGVSSDSNCSQYSASSWASELDTSSSLDPSPNTWNSYIDGGAGDQYLDCYQSLSVNTAPYSDASDISGEENGFYDNVIESGNHGDYGYDGNHVQMCSRWLKKGHNHSFPGRYMWDGPLHMNSVTNGYNQCIARDFIDQDASFHTSNLDSAIEYRVCGDVEDIQTGDNAVVDGCEYCWYCAYSVYGDGYAKRMVPGDVFYYSSNSVVLCVKQGTKESDLEVTPKSPGLNPNASVFLSTKTSTPGSSQPQDTGQWDQNDSGINNNSSSDFSYANGDVSSDKSDAGVFSPTSDSPFQQDYSYADNPVFNESSVMKLESTLNSLSVDNQYNTNTAARQANFSVDSNLMFPDSQFTAENGAPASQVQSEDSIPAPMAVDSDLSDDQLRQTLKSKLESYFSRENLSNDSYLQSQMDTDQYVPIATVASLDHVQRLTADLNLIVELLRESTYVQVDEKGEKVRPNHNRCIVILREIPDDTPVEEVKQLFSGQNCPKFVNCEFAHNSNWYVTFDSDSDAQVAYKYLREEVKTFKGKPIMARIKAKPLIRNYDSRNGYIKRMAPPPQQSGQIPTDVITSSAPPPQFTATPPFSLMPNPQISQYHLNGQQAIPFYPPNILQPNWPTPNPAMLDPSMVLQMNGYQATSIKVNNTVPNRTPYTNVNRNNSRNQKVMNSQHSHRDRLNSNESVPPRFLNQHERQIQNNANNNNSMHKTSPRNLDNAPISNHMSGYQGRRMESGGPGYGSHSNHSHSNHTHSAPHHHHSQHVDYNANHSYNNNSNSAGLPRGSHMVDPSQRYAGKSYKSRRRREEDGARLSRSNSSQSTPREGGHSVGHSRHSSVDKQFDYEPTSFPPLPGSGSNTTSGEVFESMLSDVVKGTAKGKEIPRSTTTMSASPTSTTMTSAVTTVTSSTHTTPPMASRDRDAKEMGSNTSVSSSSQTASQSSSSVGKQLPVRETHHSKSSVGTAAQTSQPVSNPTRSTAGVGQTSAVADSKPSSDKYTVQIQPSKDEVQASSPSSLVKLSYAQMVQRTKVAEVSANSIADKSDSSDSDGAETPLQQSNKPNQPSQSNAKPPNSVNRIPTKDFPRKDSRDCDREYREDTRKDNDFRREEPREQRINNRRSLKENRERKFGDRDTGRRIERRDREGPPREREGPRTAVAK